MTRIGFSEKEQVPKIKKCVGCGTEFQPQQVGRKYCSYDCFAKKRKVRKRGRIVKCSKCKKLFYLRPSNIKKNNYCSYKCHYEKMKKRILLKCKKCGKEYERPRSQVKWRGSNFCSKTCQYSSFRKTNTLSLDKLWSEIVKLKANHKCEYCGKTEGLNSHHLFSRTNRSTRWDSDNGLCLCVSHHILGNFSAHKSPIEFIEWIKEKRGEEWYKKLRFRANSIYKPDYSAIGLLLNSELEKLQPRD